MNLDDLGPDARPSMRTICWRKSMPLPDQLLLNLGSDTLDPASTTWDNLDRVSMVGHGGVCHGRRYC